jgi:hypothetical protein
MGLAQAVGIPDNPELGFCIMLTNNCLDQRASGVILEIDNADPGILPYYFKGGLPDFKAVETDAQGAGGWAFVPVGQATAEARLAATATLIGVAGFYGRPNYISYVPMGPTPRP